MATASITVNVAASATVVQRDSVLMGSVWYNADATNDAIITVTGLNGAKVLQKRHLVAGESTDDWYGETGKDAKGGIAVAITGGGAANVSGSVSYR